MRKIKIRSVSLLITYLALTFFFFLRDVRLRIWRPRNISISGTNLTNINFANVSDQIKFIDAVKYY